MNGNGTGAMEENGHTDTQIDSIVLEEKEVSINLETGEPEENGKVDEVERSVGEQVM